MRGQQRRLRKQPALTGGAKARGRLGDQGLYRPCPSLSEGVPRKLVLSLTVGSPRRTFPTFRREQARSIANLPSKTLRAPRLYLFFPSEFQILSPAAEMAPNSAFRPGQQRGIPLGSEAASSSRSHLPEVHSPRIRTFRLFQRSLLSPSAGENSRVLRQSGKQALTV